MGSIRSYVTPEFLYRFRNIGREAKRNKKLGRELDAIVSGYLWGASFDQMNDPMEGFFETRAMERESIDIRRAVQNIRNNKLQIGLCCFNERADNELMWAHYADQFYGVCVAYNFMALQMGLPDATTFSRIAYSEEIPKVSIPGGMLPPERGILSTKNHRWAYEREWRMFGGLERNPYKQDRWQVVSKVYVGNRVNDVILGIIRDKLGAVGIQVERITVKGYSIVIEPPSFVAVGKVKKLTKKAGARSS